MQIDGYTRLAAVVATPIKHSISPFIHNYAFEKNWCQWCLCCLGYSRVRTASNFRKYHAL